MGINAIGMGMGMGTGTGSGVSAAEIAEVLLQSEGAQGKQDDLVRQGEEAVQDQDEQSQISALHDKASAERSAANWSMAGGILEGAADAASGGLELGGATQAGAEAAPLIAHGAQWGKLAKGVGEAGSAVLKREASEKQVDGTDDDTTAAQFEHQANDARRAADDAGDAAKKAQDFQDKTLDFLREYESTSAQASMAALHRA